MKTVRARGIAAALGAFGCWGLFPLYFHHLEPTTPLEILAHRIVWSFLLTSVLLFATGTRGWMGSLWSDKARLGRVVVTSLMLAANWLIYVAAVAAGHVLDASLGYFINPIATVLMGVFFLHEKLERYQWVAVGLGGTAIAVLTIGYGRVPWIALGLAASFATYGYLKKTLAFDSLEGLAAETTVLVPAAAAYLIWAAVGGTMTFGHTSMRLNIMLIALGVVTSVPLILFGVATNALPLSLLGLMQYVTPVTQMLIATFVFHEELKPERLAGFVLVWSALIVLGVGSIRQGRANAAN